MRKCRQCETMVSNLNHNIICPMCAWVNKVAKHNKKPRKTKKLVDYTQAIDMHRA